MSTTAKSKTAAHLTELQLEALTQTYHGNGSWTGLAYLNASLWELEQMGLVYLAATGDKSGLRWYPTQAGLAYLDRPEFN